MPYFRIPNFLFYKGNISIYDSNSIYDRFYGSRFSTFSPWIHTQEPLPIVYLTFGHSRDKITFRLGGVPGLLGVTLPLSYNGTQSSGNSPLRTTALKDQSLGWIALPRENWNKKSLKNGGKDTQEKLQILR